MKKLLPVSALILMACIPAQPWSNGGQSTDVNHVLFGTHDYIAL
jgi:hypothetical protein